MLFNAHHDLGFFEWKNKTNILKTDRETNEGEEKRKKKKNSENKNKINEYDEECAAMM